MKREYLDEMANMLQEFGGFYTVDDILQAINEGQMQSFVENNSWVVTQINDFPRRRAVEIVILVGDKADIPALNAQVETFARDVGATLLMAAGRNGFKDVAPTLGWTQMNMNFVREVSGT